MTVAPFPTELSKKCKQFVVAYWGKDGLEQVRERPVTWVRHQANPYLKQLRRRTHRRLPLIAVQGTIQQIYLRLSTEKRRSA